MSTELGFTSERWFPIVGDAVRVYRGLLLVQALRCGTVYDFDGNFLGHSPYHDVDEKTFKEPGKGVWETEEAIRQETEELADEIIEKRGQA